MSEPLTSNEQLIERTAEGGWRYTDAAFNARWLKRVLGKTYKEPGGCWRWQGFRGHTGYGQTNYRGRNMNVHRAMYQVYFGVKLATEQYVLHTCDNRACLNPDHLWVGTQRENLYDMISKGRHNYKDKTHCLRGHLLAGDNVRIDKQHGKDGIRRTCLECDRLRRKGLI